VGGVVAGGPGAEKWATEGVQLQRLWWWRVWNRQWLCLLGRGGVACGKDVVAGRAQRRKQPASDESLAVEARRVVHMHTVPNDI
jgi:hypothetical protein